MSSVDVKITGLEELARDIQHAANVAPDEFQTEMKRIGRKFLKDLRAEARGTYQTAALITSGFKMEHVNASRDLFEAKFYPEGRGNKGHAWHLQEEGYELTRPTWWSRKKVVRYSDGGTTLKFMPGHHIVDKILPEFEDYAEDAVTDLINSILEEHDL